MCKPQKPESALNDAVVSLNEKIARETYRMILTTRDWRGDGPAPGQFLMLRVSDDCDPLLARPFGISAYNNKGKGAEIEIVYKVVGRGTAIMERWRSGQGAAFLGPLGTGFTLPPEGSTSLLVAGGVGLPPLLALAREMEILGRGGEICLLYGDANRDRLVDPGSDIFPDVKIETCTEDGSCGNRGLVTDLLREKICGKGYHVFTCGPNPMMKAVMDLTAHSCAAAQYSLEARMACGFGVCTGCAVKMASGEYVRVCREGPVFDGSDLSEESFKEI
jgi:dihydroorotate dehydrogenase electron transfer subunit